MPLFMPSLHNGGGVPPGAVCLDLTTEGGANHTAEMFMDQVHRVGVRCHVCEHETPLTSVDDYCGVCTQPTHVCTSCMRCMQFYGNTLNHCAMEIRCCDDHAVIVCSQCMWGIGAAMQILGVCRNTLRRAGITRHPNPAPLDTTFDPTFY